MGIPNRPCVLTAQDDAGWQIVTVVGRRSSARVVMRVTALPCTRSMRAIRHLRITGVTLMRVFACRWSAKVGSGDGLRRSGGIGEWSRMRGAGVDQAGRNGRSHAARVPTTGVGLIHAPSRMATTALQVAFGREPPPAGRAEPAARGASWPAPGSPGGAVVI